jgi:glutathione synthase/RimK-type ligase-like ATP-grasp enzyme
MKIAIHKSERKGYFSEQWLTYCEKKQIPYKIVNCYDSEIINQLADCDALMWHFSHADAKDFLFAKQLIKAVEEMGLVVLPNYNSCWHFDDKVAQKYLLEALKIPAPQSFVFYEKGKALQWAEDANYPKVFKLRSGASAANVFLVKNRLQAKRFIDKAFAKGFRQFNRKTEIHDSFKRFLLGSESFLHFVKSFGKLFIRSRYEKVRGRDRGYVFFQDFIDNINYDTRLIVIGEKAYGLIRLNRRKDFRASGSGDFVFNHNQINVKCVELAFKISESLHFNCMSYDFLINNNEPLIVEISYAFGTKGSSNCNGYWNRSLKWNESDFRGEEWMVDYIVEQIKNKEI